MLINIRIERITQIKLTIDFLYIEWFNEIWITFSHRLCEPIFPFFLVAFICNIFLNSLDLYLCNRFVLSLSFYWPILSFHELSRFLIACLSFFSLEYAFYWLIHFFILKKACFSHVWNSFLAWIVCLFLIPLISFVKTSLVFFFLLL